MPRVRRLLTIVLLAAAAGLLIAAGVIRVMENRLTYFPPRYPEGFVPQEAYGVQIEDVWLHTADGVKINAFFHSNPDSKQVLLWFHGNAENIGYGLSQMRGTGDGWGPASWPLTIAATGRARARRMKRACTRMRTRPTTTWSSSANSGRRTSWFTDTRWAAPWR